MKQISSRAQQQSQFLRTQQFDLLDIKHIAEELEDVARVSNLAHRMIVLIAHLLKWQFQPERRGRSCNSLFVINAARFNYISSKCLV
ncbi:MAG: DUF29 family protein [Thiotrichaceae bacterium]